MDGQAAACVPLARGDLSRIENSALDIATLVKTLRSTLSTYAWSMKKIREDFRSITADAQKASLAVSTCGESAFIHLEDSQRASLQPQASLNNYSWIWLNVLKISSFPLGDITQPSTCQSIFKGYSPRAQRLYMASICTLNTLPSHPVSSLKTRQK